MAWFRVTKIADVEASDAVEALDEFDSYEPEVTVAPGEDDEYEDDEYEDDGYEDYLDEDEDEDDED